MEELINIGNQHFYYSTVDQIEDDCALKESCAIIIDDFLLEELLGKGFTMIGKNVNQIIIISENVNKALSQLIGKDVLLLSAGSLKEAVGIAVLGEDLNKYIICIPKEDKDGAKSIVELLSV